MNIYILFYVGLVPTHGQVVSCSPIKLKSPAHMKMDFRLIQWLRCLLEREEKMKKTLAPRLDVDIGARNWECIGYPEFRCLGVAGILTAGIGSNSEPSPALRPVIPSPRAPYFSEFIRDLLCPETFSSPSHYLPRDAEGRLASKATTGGARWSTAAGGVRRR